MFRSFYASGMDGNRSCKLLLMQAQYWADPKKHLEVVKKMYKKRFPEMDVENIPLERLRGAEGKRVAGIYKEYAERYHVEWTGRQYDVRDWDNQNIINQMLSVGNDLLYNICHAVIITLGFSPELGFIHTGKMRSFVWDIADMYKHFTVIPSAFEIVSLGGNYSDLRQDLRGRIWEERVIKNMVKDLYELFDIEPGRHFSVNILPALWDGSSTIAGGKNYAKH